jgi:SAM-dependent methyltransferase
VSRPARTASALAGRTVDALPTGARRRVRAVLGRPGPRHLSLDELDAELDRATALMATSPDEAHALLRSFVLALPSSPPANPFSDSYREWTWALYRSISGRDSYDTSHEASPFDLELARERPFPYQTGSLAMVGRDLAARGHLLRCLSDLAPRRVVEFGPGWGNVTADRVATGLDVTAVEVDENFCRLVAERGHGPGRLDVEQADMLTFFAGERYDAAVFYESFHHCADHLAMLRHLHGIVRPEGAVFFAAEPVQRLEYPWGPRLDGLSVWSSRTHGWLELGFDERYFFQALARTGWHGERLQAGARPGETDVIVARSAFSGGERVEGTAQS